MTSPDYRLRRLATSLDEPLGRRLLELLAADSKAVNVIELQERVERAEAVQREAVRQLKVRNRQCDELRAQVAELQATNDDQVHEYLTRVGSAVLRLVSLCVSMGHENPGHTLDYVDGDDLGSPERLVWAAFAATRGNPAATQELIDWTGTPIGNAVATLIADTVTDA